MRPDIALALVLCCLVACKSGAKLSIVGEATDTASAVFKAAKDEARIERDKVASEQLGRLAAGSALTVEELQPLKGLVAASKADGKVTPDEADRILVEMERVAALHPKR
jgi:hypothetical protein